MYSNRQLFQLIWPLIIEQTLSVLVGMIDVLMIAVLGEAAVSGVSLVDSINILMTQVLAAVATGGAIVCAQYIGQNNVKKANKAAGQLLCATFSIASLVMLFCLGGNRALLKLIFGKTEKAVMDNAVTYFWLTALSYPFLAMYNSGAALFRTMNNSRISMVISLFMNAFNIIGNAICIFLLHMGVAGVAIPTLLSRIFAAVSILCLLRDKKNVIRIQSAEDLLPDWRLIKKIMGIGIPNGIENGMFQFGKLMLSSLVSTLGTPAIASYAVACNLVMFLYLPGNTLGMALITIVGRCVGAGEYEQAKGYIKKMILLDYAFLLVLSTGLGIFRGFFVGLYHLSGQAAYFAMGLVLIHCIAMIIWPPAFVLPHAFRAANDVKFTLILSVGSMWVFRVALAYFFILVLKMNVLGVWYAMFIDWIFRFILCLWRFRGFSNRVLTST